MGWIYQADSGGAGEGCLTACLNHSPSNHFSEQPDPSCLILRITVAVRSC